MKTIKIMAAFVCGIALFASCTQETGGGEDRGTDKETIIIKEETKETPVVVEEDKEGLDVKIGTNKDGNVDVEVEGKVNKD